MYDASSEINTHFTFYQTIEQKFEHSSTTRSGSVEIEVDPNLYENCVTPVDDTWAGFPLKNTHCHKLTVTLVSKSHSLVNNEQNIYVRNSIINHFDITNEEYPVGNGQGRIAATGNLKRLVESELDDKQKNMRCEESGIEARETNEDGSEIFIETPRVEESGDSYDLRSRCTSEEQLDMKLSRF
jgi:ribosomal protein L31